MIRILDIAAKDLLQSIRERQTFLFRLILPIVFTLLMGFAFGSNGGDGDPRIPVGYLDQDQSRVSREVHDLLAASEVIRLEVWNGGSIADLEAQVADEKLAGAIIVPPRYAHDVLHGKPAKLIVIADTSTPTGTSVQSEALSNAIRLEGSVRTALIMERLAGDQAPFEYAFEQALVAWKDPPISVEDTTSAAIQAKGGSASPFAHYSPGMMLQFSIAGLLVSAQLIVNERKTRSLQRLLTTATSRVHILLGHTLAIYIQIFLQFVLLIAFAQIILGLDYFSELGATLLMAFTAASCIAALGLLIGTIAKTEEQAVIFSLVPMFVFAGLGGAWVPLDVTGPTFQTVGHFTPLAWAMDGFENIVSRGLGIESVLLPAAMLAGYGLLFFALAVWRFQVSQES